MYNSPLSLASEIRGPDTNSLGRDRACRKRRRLWLNWHASALPEFHAISLTATTAVRAFFSRLPEFGNSIQKPGRKSNEQKDQKFGGGMSEFQRPRSAVRCVGLKPSEPRMHTDSHRFHLERAIRTTIIQNLRRLRRFLRVLLTIGVHPCPSVVRLGSRSKVESRESKVPFGCGCAASGKSVCIRGSASFPWIPPIRQISLSLSVASRAPRQWGTRA